MGIIDVIVEKPASEREERGEEGAEETTSEGPEGTAEEPGRGRSLSKMAGVLAIGLVGLLTLRRLRKGRGNEPEEGGAGERTG